MKTFIKETKHFENALLIYICKWSIVLGRKRAPFVLCGTLVWFEARSPSKWIYKVISMRTLCFFSVCRQLQFFPEFPRRLEKTMQWDCSAARQIEPLEVVQGGHPKAEVVSNHIRSSAASQVHGHFPLSVENTYWALLLVSSGHHNKILQTGQLRRQKLISLKF